MEENTVTRNFNVLEDDFGLIVAVDEEGWIHLSSWLSDHCEELSNLGYVNYATKTAAWESLLTQDDDRALDEVKSGNGMTARQYRDKLAHILDVNGFNCYGTQGELGSYIFDFYILQKMDEDITQTFRTLNISADLKKLNPERQKRARKRADMAWYDYVREWFIPLITDDLNESKLIGRYILTEPKFEQRFNELHAKHDAAAAPSPATATSDTSANSTSANCISQQQMYAMMMAPNGRCPKCNHPLNTRNAGLSAGKAAAGGIFAGPVGAVVGASMGRKEYYCPACGYVR